MVARDSGECFCQPWLWPSDAAVGFLASRIVKEYIFVILTHQVCGNLLL